MIGEETKGGDEDESTRHFSLTIHGNPRLLGRTNTETDEDLFKQVQWLFRFTIHDD